MSEIYLQEHIKRVFEKAGWWVGHLEPPAYPGFHDLLMFKGTESRLIEVKDFNMIRGKTEMWRVFQPSQPPMFIKMLGCGVVSYVVGMLSGSNYLIVMSDLDTVKDILSMERDEYLERRGVKLNGLEELLDL